MYGGGGWGMCPASSLLKLITPARAVLSSCALAAAEVQREVFNPLQNSACGQCGGSEAEHGQRARIDLMRVTRVIMCSEGYSRSRAVVRDASLACRLGGLSSMGIMVAT